MSRHYARTTSRKSVRRTLIVPKCTQTKQPGSLAHGTPTAAFRALRTGTIVTSGIELP